MSDAYDLFDLLRGSLPILVVQMIWFVGMVLAVMRWRRHPQVSLFTLLALSLFSLASFMNLAISWWFMRGSLDVSDPSIMEVYFTIFGVAHAGLYAVGAILLLVALFGWRYPPPHLVIETDLHEPQAPGDWPFAPEPPPKAIKWEKPLP
jgi:hypothetical protein